MKASLHTMINRPACNIDTRPRMIERLIHKLTQSARFLVTTKACQALASMITRTLCNGLNHAQISSVLVLSKIRRIIAFVLDPWPMSSISTTGFLTQTACCPKLPVLRDSDWNPPSLRTHHLTRPTSGSEIARFVSFLMYCCPLY